MRCETAVSYKGFIWSQNVWSPNSDGGCIEKNWTSWRESSCSKIIRRRGRATRGRDSAGGVGRAAAAVTEARTRGGKLWTEWSGRSVDVCLSLCSEVSLCLNNNLALGTARTCMLFYLYSPADIFFFSWRLHSKMYATVDFFIWTLTIRFIQNNLGVQYLFIFLAKLFPYKR